MNHWLKVHRRKRVKDKLKQAKNWPGAAVWYGGDSQRQDWWNMRPQTYGHGSGTAVSGVYGFRIES